MSKLYFPPSHIVYSLLELQETTPCFPGITHFHLFKSILPSGDVTGCAYNVNTSECGVQKSLQDDLFSTVSFHPLVSFLPNLMCQLVINYY